MDDSRWSYDTDGEDNGAPPICHVGDKPFWSIAEATEYLNELREAAERHPDRLIAPRQSLVVGHMLNQDWVDDEFERIMTYWDPTWGEAMNVHSAQLRCFDTH